MQTKEETIILNAKQLVNKIGLSRTTIWRMENRGEFPKRIALSPRRIGWIVEEIEEWLMTRKRL